MLGLIQKVLFDLIESVGGEDANIKIRQLADVPLDKVFNIGADYSDQEWQRLFAATLEILNISAEEANEAYANAFLTDVLERFPTWFSMSKNSYQFLLRQPTIHNVLAKGVDDEESRNRISDKFRIEEAPNKLITYYKSPNRHCKLYVALARCVVDYYKDKATIKQTRCTESGDSECEIHIQWQLLNNPN